MSLRQAPHGKPLEFLNKICNQRVQFMNFRQRNKDINKNNRINGYEENQKFDASNKIIQSLSLFFILSSQINS
ncbi:unnamed protein product [Paramecium sonneborni]|uniref:Uncharacterized protein n=1 Tax=Paramecium sonneborni TaxID=65129 RepID=A0A8S1QT92_9CILI|nr:unnamed protein product [Paramecium sonneborni]